MGGEPEVDVVAFDGATGVFASGVAVAGDVEDGAVGEVAFVDGGGAVAGLGAGGGNADFFGLAFIGAVGVDGLAKAEPGAFPTAAVAAVAVAGDLHEDDFWLDAFGRADVGAARREEEACGE